MGKLMWWQTWVSRAGLDDMTSFRRDTPVSLPEGGASQARSAIVPYDLGCAFAGTGLVPMPRSSVTSKPSSSISANAFVEVANPGRNV